MHRTITVEYRKDSRGEWQASMPSDPDWRGPHAAVPDHVRKFAESEIFARHQATGARGLTISITHRFVYKEEEDSASPPAQRLDQGRQGTAEPGVRRGAA